MTGERKEREPELGTMTRAGRSRLTVALAGHRGDVADASRGLTDPAPEVRATALRALVRLGRAPSTLVRTAADDADPAVRAAACEATLHLPITDAIAVLEPLLADAHSSVVEAAAFSTGELGASATPLVPRLAGLVRHGDTIVRETAVAALGAVGDPSGLPAILAATKDRATVRRRAIIALAPFDGTDVDDALAAALGDRDWQVRQAAEDQLDPTERQEETP